MVEWEKRKEAHFDSAEGYMLLSMYEEALAQTTLILETEPDEPRALYLKGIILIQLKKYVDAEATFDHLKEIKPNNPDLYVHLAYIHRRTKGLDSAIKTISEALKLDPHLPIANYNLACYCSVNRDIEPALKYLKKAIIFNNEFANAAKTDEDFDAIRDDPRFSAVLNWHPGEKNQEN
jgi:tetratricopeptide (TPR) repeat protein